MDFDAQKIGQIITDYEPRIRAAKQAREYYNNDNVIRSVGVKPSNNDGAKIRTADNRISHNFHELLVNQKAAYLFTYPPIFDTGKKSTNNKIADVLGDKFRQVCNALCVEASNTSIGWLHYWVDSDTKEFKYAIVPFEQIVPIYKDALDRELENVIRGYKTRDGVEVLEFWDDKHFIRCTKEGGNIKTQEDISHDLGAIPFIPFYNNSALTGDLKKYKDLIDQYDRIISGFCNDIDDIQQIIYIIKNYGGADLQEFTADLKRFKTVKVDGDGGLESMQIDIPVEAKAKLLEILRKQIYVSGQGVDPDVQIFSNTSGAALKYMYSLLELKAGNMETEFRLGFSQLLQAVLRHIGIKSPMAIKQTWTRNIITNDSETAAIANQSMGVISQKTILQNHPWVDDPEAEEKQLEIESGDNYGNLNKEPDDDQ